MASIIPQFQINSSGEAPSSGIRCDDTNKTDASEKYQEETLDIVEQDPFHDEDRNAKQYKTMKWGHAAFLMVAEIISLGILSLPAGIAILGYTKSLICQVIVGLLATYTGYLIWKFKMRHPTIQSFADAGRIMGGRYVEWIFMVAGYLNLVFIAAAHILTFKTAMTHITKTSLCAILWSVIAVLVSFVLTLKRTSLSQSYVSVLSCLSITVAIIIVATALALHPTSHLSDPTPTPHDFPHSFRAILNMVTAYCGHVAFVGFIAELREPASFPKALAVTEIAAITYYCVVAALMYHFAGPLVASPAINSAPQKWRLAAWVIAMPTIVVAGVINMHVATKQVYVRYWRGTSVVGQRTLKSYTSWIGMLAGGWALAWILAEAIPDFHNFLAFLSALFNGWFMLTIPALFWLHMHKGAYFKDWKRGVVFAVNIGIVAIGLMVFVIGMYTSGIALAHGEGGRSFSCTTHNERAVEHVLNSHRSDLAS